MSVKRLIGGAVLAAAMFTLNPSNADAAIARKPAAAYRPMESISFNRAQVRPKLSFAIALRFVVFAMKGSHAGWIEIGS